VEEALFGGDLHLQISPQGPALLPALSRPPLPDVVHRESEGLQIVFGSLTSPIYKTIPPSVAVERIQAYPRLTLYTSTDPRIQVAPCTPSFPTVILAQPAPAFNTPPRDSHRSSSSLLASVKTSPGSSSHSDGDDLPLGIDLDALKKRPSDFRMGRDTGLGWQGHL
jgi:hypothetical protein